MEKAFSSWILAGLALAVPMLAACDPPAATEPPPQGHPPASEPAATVSTGEMIRQNLVLEISMDQGTAGGGSQALTIAYEIRNRGAAPVTLYLDGCGICFWSVSLNGGDYIPQQTAVHVMPCRHRQLRTVPPGDKIRSAGLDLTPLLSSIAPQPCRSVRLRYKFGGLMDEDAFLESNLLTLPPE